MKIFVGGYSGSGTRVPQVILESAGFFTGDLVAAEIDYLPLEAFMPQLLHDTNVPELYGIQGLRVKTHKELLDKVFASFIDKEENWSIKHGFLMLAIPYLREAYPDCKFILTVRHAVDTATNKHFMEEDVGQYYNFDHGNDILEKRVNFWSFCYEKALEDGRALGDDFHVMKFEDMITNPKEEIKKMLDKLGIDADINPDVIKNSGTIGRRNKDIVIYPANFPYFADLDKERLYKLGEKTLKKFGYEI